jgi:predicted ATPase
MNNKRFVILTGGPGAGKTTLLQALEARDYTVVPEVARNIIQEQMVLQGDALPWKNREAYTQLMLERSEADWMAAQAHTGIVFFDRGVPDALAYAQLIEMPVTPAMQGFAARCRYHRQVFILPFWEAIYTTDTERKQSVTEAQQTFEVLLQTYRSLGYTVTIVPIGTPEQRADFVLQQPGL